MSALEVVAKPEFGKAQLEWLVRIRETRAHISGPPTFTLVFPGAESAVDVVKHVEATCMATPRIRFCLRSAIVVPDERNGGYHVFLVPDEGFAAITRLHDRLHVGPLARCMRLDVPYIPHVTVATTTRADDARRLMASLNARDLAIAGHVDEVEVRERAPGTIPRCIATVPLKHGFFH